MVYFVTVLVCVASVSLLLSPDNAYATDISVLDFPSGRESRVYPRFESGGSIAWGSYTNTSREIMCYGTSSSEPDNTQRSSSVIYGGNVTHIKMYHSNAAASTGLYLKIWRRNGLTYDAVGVSQNLRSQITSAGIQTLQIDPPIIVQAGDLVGFRLTSSGVSTTEIQADVSAVGFNCYSYSNRSDMGNGTDWLSLDPVADNPSMSGSFFVPLEVYIGTGPRIVFTGDSITFGSCGTYDPAISYPYQLANEKISGLTYYNGAVPGISSSHLVNGVKTEQPTFKDFGSDVNAPVLVLLIGTNDIAVGDSWATFVANLNTMKSMLDAKNTNLIMTKILPRTSFSSTLSATIDTWNGNISTWVAENSVPLIDLNEIMGQYRGTGPLGNLWDLKTSYDCDETHPNEAGYDAMATAVAQELINLYGYQDSPPSVTTFSATGTSTVTVTMNGNITADGNASSTVRGFAWGTDSDLSLGDTATTTDTEGAPFDLGSFTKFIDDLIPNTTYYFRAYAANSAGTSTGSILSFNTNDITSPSVSITSLSGGANISGLLVSLSATSTDDVAVAGVTFYRDTTAIGSEITSTSSPNTYSTTWDTTSVADGSYTITAVSRDTSGNYATSSSIVITVNNTPPTVPAVPSSHSSSSGGSTASSRVRNLISMGNYQLAGEIARQYGITIPGQNTATPITYTVAPISNLIEVSAFSRALRFGMTNNDVKKLQIFLNKQGFTVSLRGAGSSGNETNYFGSATKAALMKFQETYRKDTLDPQGLKSPTGFFGRDTMKTVNSMLFNR